MPHNDIDWQAEQYRLGRCANCNRALDSEAASVPHEDKKAQLEERRAIFKEMDALDLDYARRGVGFESGERAALRILRERIKAAVIPSAVSTISGSVPAKEGE